MISDIGLEIRICFISWMPVIALLIHVLLIVVSLKILSALKLLVETINIVISFDIIILMRNQKIFQNAKFLRFLNLEKKK